MLTVVLESDGFASLLETVDFLRRIQESDEKVLGAVRGGRRDALAQRRLLTKLAVPPARGRRRRAPAQRRAEGDGRGPAQPPRGARAGALGARRRAARQPPQPAQRRAHAAAPVAQRNRAIGQVGPGGPWAIPWVIVQCESGGQNVPPNSAGASGYYQFMPATWRGLGGSTPHAYQASKAEQDRLAARLWDGGRGASNWDCAALVGIL